MILRWVTKELEVHEEFLGLYNVASIDAAMLTTAIKDVLIRANVPYEKLHGQCYDGAGAMRSSKCGVAKRICDLEPRAVYTAGDTLKQSKLLKESLETTQEITKLIKFSP